MGTRPKPTEHIETSEDDSPNRRQVAESTCDEPILHTGTGLQQPEYQQLYPEQQQIDISISQSIAQQQQQQQPTVSIPSAIPQDITKHALYLSQFSQNIVTLPSISSTMPESSRTVPKLKRISELQPQQQLPLIFSDQPGPSGLQKSIKTVIPSMQPKKIRSKKVICEICQKSFMNTQKLQAHIKAAHLHIQEDISSTGGSSTESSSTQPFTCEHCKKNFSSKFKLVRHLLIHSDRRQFSCSVCERTFHRKDHLKNHIKIHSPTKNVYVCDRVHCKKEYTSILSYKKHLAIHCAEEGYLDCKICSKKFETKQDLLYHLKIHAGTRTLKNPNEKKFRCEICDRKFFTRKDVRRHLVVHTGRRDFLCQFCPQRFGRKDHLVRHIKKSHSSEDILTVKKEIEVDPNLIKLEPPYGILSSASTSYFGEETKSLKTEEMTVSVALEGPSTQQPQQPLPSVASIPSGFTTEQPSQHSAAIIKLEQDFELLPSTSGPFFTGEKSIKSEEDIMVASVEIESASSQELKYSVASLTQPFSTETHLIPSQFSMETEQQLQSMLHHPQITEFPESTTFQFPSTSFAGLLIEEQHHPQSMLEQSEIGIEQTSRPDEILSHEFSLEGHGDILRSEGSVLHDPDILEFISESDLMMPSHDEDSKPLPGFSQAFQKDPSQKE